MHFYKLLTIVFIACVLTDDLCGQEIRNEIFISDTTIYAVVDTPPYFEGCDSLITGTREKKQCADKKMLKFIDSNLRYPEVARNNGVQGIVVVSFIIEKDGTITSPKIIKNIGGRCGEEAIRIVSLMPNWEPGMKNDKIVRTRFNLPVLFKIPDYRETKKKKKKRPKN